MAVPLGILAAVKQGSWIDHTCRVVATAGVSLPVFFTGLLLVYVFYFLLGWAPAPIGRLDVFYSAAAARHRLLSDRRLLAGDLGAVPRGAGAACAAGGDARALLARADRAHDARLDAGGAGVRFRAHRARQRAQRRTVIMIYAFRNAMLPVVTTLGMVFSFMLGANVLVEKVFAWPGIGSFAVEALIVSDYAPVQGFVLTMAILFVALNLAIDILYSVIDPRVRIDA